jgi:hypothetical protein
MATLITNNGIQRMDDNALEHFGILGMKWGIRRYQPYGDGGYNPKTVGKEIGQAKKARAEKSKQKDLAIGTKRLNNRLNRYENAVDNASWMIGDHHRANAINTERARKMTQEVLADENRLQTVGHKTRQLRNQAIIASSAGVGASIVAAMAAESAAPLIATPVMVAAGAAYVHKLMRD